MASKFWKKYERAFLLALVVVLIALFSVTGALSGCFERGPGSQYALGGTFKVSPAESETLSDEEFDSEFRDWGDFRRAVPFPSLEYRDFMFSAGDVDPFVASWSSIVTRDAAERAGYRVGPNKAKSAARDIVHLLTQRPVNDVTYREFLNQRFPGGNPAEFLKGIRQLVMKDSFIAPIVDTARYSKTYEQAYEDWKSQRERVDLEYVVLPAASFKEVVEKEERTRATISALDAEVRKLTRSLSVVRSTMTGLESLKEAAEDKAWPESLDVLVKKRAMASPPTDPWGKVLRYTVAGDDVDLRSAGRDGVFDTADDVTRDMQRQVVSHGNLRDTARALLEWRGGAGKWPATLEDLTKSAAEGRLAPLRRLKKDGFDRAFVYEAPAADGDVVLVALGPDGKPDTGDELRLLVSSETSPDDLRVPLGAQLALLVGDAANDGWGKPIDITLEGAQPITWRAVSAGPDGKLGTDDDVEGGNRQQMRDFFSQPSLKSKYRVPGRRQFEALYVHLPLLSDEVVAKLWEAFPEQRPTNEDELFQSWLSYRGADLIYSADDPADPETGHGADLAKRIAPDAPHTLVPSKDLFPKDLGAPADAAGDDEPKDDEPKDDEPKDDEPKDDDLDDDELETPDPLRTEYEEKGWREILIRQRFVENVLGSLLNEAVESERATAAWDLEHAEEDDAAPVIEVRPEQVTFDSLLEGKLNPFLAGSADADQGAQTFRYFITKKPADAEGDQWGLTREEWEALPGLGDTNVTVFLGSRSDTPAGYLPSPVQIDRRLTKALIRRIAYFPPRDSALEDVYEDVFGEYVEKRQIDRAATELAKLRADAPTPTGVESVADVEAGWKTALEKWGAAHGLPYHVERTGLFIGATPPLSVSVPDDDTSNEAVATRRRNFVWRMGYDSVRPAKGPQGPESSAPGTFGRAPLRDDKAPSEGGTASAYLVRVADRIYPTRHEFSPRRYADALMEAAFGIGDGGASSRLGDLPGTFFQALSRFTGDKEFLERGWGLTTNTPLEQPER